MSDPLALRAGAETLAAPLPPLLAEAEHLAAAVLLGEHGRRRAGLGDTFWQYRPAMDHDETRAIDWRRSARSDTTFVQDKEWQIAQSVMVWADGAASMDFASRKDLPTKATRARTLALAAAILMSRAGERVGLAWPELAPRRGEAQVARMAALLAEAGEGEYGVPETRSAPAHSRALFLSDFLGPPEPVEEALGRAADREVRGALVMVLDPAEEAFPFDGRTIFESMGGTIRHETLKAGDLRGRYLERLAERKDRMTVLGRVTGWQVLVHHTDQSAASALLWIYNALERRR
ncbi:DUF58 domain-containing protein [Wenxinia marina]|uniref:Putative conserved protein (Some members containing a von Willebrand factor type A (VWA) domain) n=1 Tax=Wenxinia marina DSM 24838 TaxID=1123501 RepID=A0A0D0NJ80_9RHOB|nr:DUF58 domain-containing protein [Wenxinia marina]KIQ68405.1 putative conserved protein (some members containing a von Willebrand factor type A (vWA) domain) [Wenxinia marina DSM 24838]GGL72458.1 hypothetical protein GCM10011392_28830 [Wenxinia marina]